MRRVICIAFIFFSLLQSSWAGLHAAFEAVHSVTHSQEVVPGELASGDADSHEDCCVQAHCCHPHATALTSDPTATLIAEPVGVDTKVQSNAPPGGLPAEIERPKWAKAAPAVATL